MNNNTNRNTINIFYYDNKMEEKEIQYIETPKNLEEKIGIITKIKLNKCCLYLCFCFARKTKNMQNILINEEMKMIRAKLDIINIFKKVYRVEKSNINSTIYKIYIISDFILTKDFP